MGKKGDCGGGGDDDDPRQRERGDRRKEGDFDQANEQLQGLEGAQRRARKEGRGDSTIQSTSKSRQNLKKAWKTTDWLKRPDE